MDFDNDRKGGRLLVNGAHIDERATRLLAAIQRGRAHHLRERAKAAHAAADRVIPAPFIAGNDLDAHK